MNEHNLELLKTRAFQTKNFLLDNNFLWSLIAINKESRIKTFFDDLEKYCPTYREGSHWVPTPFMILEAVGCLPQGKPKIEIPNDLVSEARFIASLNVGIRRRLMRPVYRFMVTMKILKQRKDTGDLSAYVFNVASKYYSSSQDVSAERIRSFADNAILNMSQEGKSLFGQIIGHKIKLPGFEKKIHQNLAFNQMYDFSYPKDLEQWIHASFSIDALRSIAEGIEISQFRAVKKSWESIKREFDRKKIMSKSDRDLLSKSLRLKDLGDLLDGEILHFPIVGKLDKYEALKPVTAFTADSNIEKTRNRVIAYKAFVNLAADYAQSLSPKQRKKIPFIVNNFGCSQFKVGNSALKKC